MTNRAVIVDAIRTPFCKSHGQLAATHADDLGAYAVTELLARTNLDPAELDEVIFGNVVQPAHAANIARIIALKAGLPEDLISHSVQRNCASGMQAVSTAATQIMAGLSECIIVGGAESMTQVPLLFGDTMTKTFMALSRAKTVPQKLAVLSKFRPAHLQPIIALQLGLTDSICELNMGQTAEILANDFHITRDEQDEFATTSHRRAAEARKQGVFASEIAPLPAPPRYAEVIEADDGIRDDQSPDKLAKLRPFFDRHAGTVTAGNACPITDGAAALLVCSEKKAKKLGLEPLGHLIAWEYAALEGARMGLGPTYAAAKLFDNHNMKLDDFEVVEINEAFAAQVIANQRAFESPDFARDHLNRDKPLGRIDPEKLNPNGGAIALGHPVGATGARLIQTTLLELKRRNAKRGLASLCIGGGQGAAFALEAA